jgi:hypothetical protein
MSGASALQPDLLAASALLSFWRRRTLAALTSLASISKAARTAVPCLDDVITCCTRAARAITPARLQTRARSSSESSSVLVAQRRTAVLSGAKARTWSSLPRAGESGRVVSVGAVVRWRRDGDERQE